MIVGIGERTTDQKNSYVGEEVKSKRDVLIPIEYGMLTNWDDVEKICMPCRSSWSALLWTLTPR